MKNCVIIIEYNKIDVMTKWIIVYYTLCKCEKCRNFNHETELFVNIGDCHEKTVCAGYARGNSR